jgi:hypothetical protein
MESIFTDWSTIPSLSATILRRRILSTIRSLENEPAVTYVEVAQSTIYSYPTVDALAVYLTASRPDTDAIDPPCTNAMEQLITKYSFADSPFDSGVSSPANAEDVVVLLTGSTGSLGSHVLEGLLRDANVAKVYTLNRPGSMTSAARHLSRFQDKGLDVDLLASLKLVHLASDYSTDNLGLSSQQYDEVDCILNVSYVISTEFFSCSLSPRST